jgi:hypothetical protein
MNDAGIFAIGFFVGFFTCAIIIYLEERNNNDRKK